MHSTQNVKPEMKSDEILTRITRTILQVQIHFSVPPGPFHMSLFAFHRENITQTSYGTDARNLS